MRGNQGETGFFFSFFTPATLLRAYQLAQTL